MVSGEFAGVGAFYVLFAAVFVFWRRLTMNKSIREEPRTGYGMPIQKEATDLLNQMVVLIYGVLASTIFFLYDFVNSYTGVWWLPYAVNLPAAVVGLYFFGNIQVVKSDFNREPGYRGHTAARYEIGEFLFFAVAFFPMYWSVFPTVLLAAWFRVMDWISLVVIAGVPLGAYGSVLVLSERVPRW